MQIAVRSGKWAAVGAALRGRPSITFTHIDEEGRPRSAAHTAAKLSNGP